MKQHQFEQLLKLSRDIICIAGIDGYFKEINPAFTKVTDWDEQYILRTPFSTFVHPHDVLLFNSAFDKLLKGDASMDFTCRFATRSGLYRLLQWSVNHDKATDLIFAIARDITEDRRKEEVLEASQHKLSAFFEHSQGLMCTHDLEGKILSINTAGAALLGYTIAEMEQMGIYDIIPDNHRVAFKTYLQGIREHGTASGQMTTVHKDGSHRIWMFNNILEKGIDEAPYIIANAIDITERYLLEKDLARTKEMLEQTNQVARVGGWVIEMTGEKLYWTDVTKEIHEVPPAFVPDMTTGIHFFKKGESQNKVIRALNRATREGKPWDLEVQIITAKGVDRWVRTFGNAEFENGVCKRLYGAFQDIDDKKKIELETLTSRKLLNDVLQSASEVSIIATDLDGLITLFNRGAERMLGYTAAEMTGKYLFDIVHDPHEVQDRGLELSAESGEIIRGMRVFVYKPEMEGSEQREWTYIHKDGSRMIVSLVVTAIRNVSGNITGYLGIAINITKRKRMEEALIAAKLQAEKMSNTKSEFLANMSHEIRTPLNGIIGFTDLVIKTKLNKEQLQYLTIVNQSAGLLLSIINDILDLSKIEAGKLELHIEQFNLQALAKEAVDMITFQAQKKGLEVYLHISDDIPKFAEGDAFRLKQVLVNLLGNAVKFTERGMISLGIRADKKTGTDQTTLLFEVKDTGIGIQPDKQERVFEAFSQEDASTTKKYGGTGIGLAISNKILAQMGSKLQLISHPGVGSTFFFSILLRMANQQLPQTGEMTPEEITSPEADGLEGLSANVLIVEDNPVNMLLSRTLIRRIMPRARIVEAVNGREAVTVCRLRMPDIIFMDIQIPELNGYEATAGIRSLDGGRHIPIIALTAGSISGEREKSFEAGMDDFLFKPVVEESLAGMFRKWLNKEKNSMEHPNIELQPETVHEHFDINVLKTYLGEDIVGEEILQLTCSEIRKSCGMLEQYILEKNLKGIKALGHKLYGTSASVGLGLLSKYARRLEELDVFDEAVVTSLLKEVSAEVTLIEHIIHQRIQDAHENT